MTKLIVILGLTGAQGGSVASLFLQDPSYRVRGITRSSSSATALNWASKGVEVIQADHDDPSTLPAAFAGAHTIFSVTDFWSPFYNPSTSSLLSPGQSLGEYCYEKELQQGKNIFDAAAKIESLERIVVSSLVDVDLLSAGRWKGVYHWDGKARSLAYAREKYPLLAGKMSVLLMGNYMGNWLSDVKLRKVYFSGPV